jgi:MFS family permease
MIIALNASIFDVGLVVFFTSLTAVPGAILWGKLSDRLHRRRPFVLIGLVSFALTLPIMAATRDLYVYLAANALLGLLQASAAATSSVLIMESFHPRQWPEQIGRFARVSGIAFVGGLLLGAAWFGLAPSVLGPMLALDALFLIGAALSAVSVVVGMFTIKEGHHRVDRQAAIDALAHLGHSIIEKRHGYLVRFTHISSLSFSGMRGQMCQPVGRFCLGIFLLFTGFLIFNAPLPVFLLREAGLAQDLIFWVYIANSTLAAALYVYAGKRCRDRSPRRALLAASWSRVLVYPMFAVAVLSLGPGSPWALIALLVLNAAAGASWAFINVASSVVAAQLARPESKGQAMGLYNAAIGAGAIAGALLGGALAANLPYLEVFLAASVVIAAGAVTVATVRVAPEPKENASAPSPATSGA